MWLRSIFALKLSRRMALALHPCTSLLPFPDDGDDRRGGHQDAKRCVQAEARLLRDAAGQLYRHHFRTVFYTLKFQYRVVQLDFTLEIDICCMRFDRSLFYLTVTSETAYGILQFTV